MRKLSRPLLSAMRKNSYIIPPRQTKSSTMKKSCNSIKAILSLWIIICLFSGIGLQAQGNPLSVDPEGLKIRVAAGQFVLAPDLETNLEKINSMLDEAHSLGVELIVFPELGLTGYPPSDYESIDYIKQDRTEEALKHLQKKALELDMAIAIGAGWKDDEGIWWNRAFFIDENGELLEYYDKIQQTSHERKFFKDGERLPAFEWKGIQLGMLICMDMRYPELWRIMRKQEVSLMLHLAAAYGGSVWKVPVLEGTMRANAASNGFHIISCNNAGPTPMMISAIYNNRGMILAKANYAVEQLIWQDIIVGEPTGFVEFQDNVYQLENKTAE